MIERTDKARLDTEEIVELIKKRKDKKDYFDNLQDYYKGENRYILDRPIVDQNNPDYKLPVPYGRKIIKTVCGYMFKSGLIRYDSDQKRYLEEVRKVFDDNDEDSKTSMIGKMVSLYGEAYELAFVTGVAKIETQFEMDGVFKFARVDPRRMIVLYNNDIEPELVVAIRFWPEKPEDAPEDKDVVSVERVDVIYAIETYRYYLVTRKKQGRLQYELVKMPDFVEYNTFSKVPVVHYMNNDELQGDFEPVIPLINGYDALASGSMTEFFRFAQAYLRLVERTLEPQDLRRLRFTRLFQGLRDKEDVTFLTKDINDAYIELMLRTMRRQIYEQSHVPDLQDERFKGDMSGVALRRMLYDFENLASDKEMFFKIGLMKRLELIDDYFKTKKIETDGSRRDMRIQFQRNLEVDAGEIAEIAERMQATTSRRTALTMFPETVVPDVDAEMRQIEEEGSMAMNFDVENLPEEEIPEE